MQYLYETQRDKNTTVEGNSGAMRFDPLVVQYTYLTQSPVFLFLIVLVRARLLIKTEVLSLCILTVFLPCLAYHFSPEVINCNTDIYMHELLPLATAS